MGATEELTTGVEASLGPSAARRILLVVTLAGFITPLGSTMVQVALPVIGRDLGVGPSALGWVVSLYYLVFGVAVPFYGRLGDASGARRLFALGLVAFSLGSLLCALSPDYTLLLVGRGVQALGTASVVGLGGALVARAYPRRERGRSLGLMAGVGAIGMVASAPLGGSVSDLLGWRYVFGLSALAGLLAPYTLYALPRQEPQSHERLDPAGGVLLGLTVGGALLAMTEASRGTWLGSVLVAPLATSVVAAFLFVLRQRLAPAPFIPRELLGNQPYVLLLGIAFAIAGGDTAVSVGIPLVLMQAGGASAGQVGAALIPGSLVGLILTPLAGRLVDRVGAMVPITAGLAAMLVSALLLSVTGGVPLLTGAVLYGLQSAGLALTGSPIVAKVSLVARSNLIATATSLTEMSFYLGAGFGTALLTTVLGVREGTKWAINPLHTGPAPAYSDAFLAALAPLLVAVVLTVKLWRSERATAAEAWGETEGK